MLKLSKQYTGTTEELLNYPFYFAPPIQNSILDDREKAGNETSNAILTFRNLASYI